MTMFALGDPSKLTWAVFDYPDGLHAMPGRYSVHTIPEWPADHVPSAVCPCGPDLFTESQVAPRLLFQHHRLVWLTSEAPSAPRSDA